MGRVIPTDQCVGWIWLTYGPCKTPKDLYCTYAKTQTIRLAVWTDKM